ncbi:type IV conjugative transfer system protein TraE [Klebsiella pneumoniae]|uniref:type IV conjugative transfer system protein TraE n=1 Tax=Klebsiella pneumoniae TaxID=573 RepID=UPI0011BA03C7|nr:type IV conjugative transfer system protein TraE [Klebsiella pneumoniae]TWY00960.1 type IV conjugative transfer system protein TraE [Klebsiella pneumoniae]
MEHGARQDTTRVIAVGFISLGTLLTLSLATNIIQGINNYRLQTEQKVAVTPMLFRAPFAVSQNQADASYIEQLGLSFVALRLNVTPETVDAQHQQLLRYVLPASQNSLKVQLAEDAKRIKDNNVNSTFYMTSMRAWPAENRVDIRGELKTWIGDSKPYSEIKSYVIQFSRVDGVSWLARFGEINNEKN